MNSKDSAKKISELEQKISTLPHGSIRTRNINGKNYFSHRYTINGERKEVYVKAEDVENLRCKIAERKQLENELKEIKKTLPKTASKKSKINNHEFKTFVRINEQLIKWTLSIKDYKHRDCFNQLKEYINSNISDKVFVLYGLRRTGKTTLLRQIVNEMSEEQRNKTAFIQISSNNTLSSINSDLKYLEQNGYKYVFVDEITLMEDFIEGAALFSDIYASSGMKIVLSGTDSLGFVFTESEQLYDRCIMLHTTLITYKEFEEVLGIKGIDEFIKYGGTMSMSGINYNESSSFSSKKKADEYINTAVAHNIQHSLKYYQDGGHFRHLYSLYSNNELTNAINRVVEDINHNFTKEVLTRVYKSPTLSITARNLLKDKDSPFDLLENINQDFVISSIKQMLDILDKEEQTVEINEAHVQEIREYLLLLDLITEINQVHLPDTNVIKKMSIITQPGLRYAQAEALVNSLILDEKFNELSLIEKSRVTERVMNTIQGRMMEELVLLETHIANPNKEVFQLQFAIGEFDMVIYNPKTLSCEIYEIKHSKEVVPEQTQHLLDAQKCAMCEHQYGTITGKYVIYRGENFKYLDVEYLNVEKYLINLFKDQDK